MKSALQRFNERNKNNNSKPIKNKILLSFIFTLIPSLIWKETDGFGTQRYVTIDFYNEPAFNSISSFFAAIIDLLLTMVTFSFYPLIVTFLLFRKNWFQYYLILLTIYVTIKFLPAFIK